jgi:hypothetical protein
MNFNAFSRPFVSKDMLWYGTLFTAAFVLSACASVRFQSSSLPESGPQIARAQASHTSVFNAPGPVALDPAPASPSGAVLAQTLPPLPGANASPGTTGSTSGIVDMGVPAPGVSTADVPASTPQILAPVSPSRVATLTPTPAAAPSPVSRNGVVGGWTAKDATGTTCRITLSSSPALDLYRASAAGCSNRDLSRVTAWDFRDGDVYLYQPGGAVAARLKGNAKNLDGALAKSGAPVSMVR